MRVDAVPGNRELDLQARARVPDGEIRLEHQRHLQPVRRAVVDGRVNRKRRFEFTRDAVIHQRELPRGRRHRNRPIDVERRQVRGLVEVAVVQQHRHASPAAEPAVPAAVASERAEVPAADGQLLVERQLDLNRVVVQKVPDLDASVNLGRYLSALRVERDVELLDDVHEDLVSSAGSLRRSFRFFNHRSINRGSFGVSAVNPRRRVKRAHGCAEEPVLLRWCRARAAGFAWVLVGVYGLVEDALL